LNAAFDIILPSTAGHTIVEPEFFLAALTASIIESGIGIERMPAAVFVLSTVA
jgi:hypothetical protein